MEFAISKQVLADELNKLQSVIPKKSVIASLSLIKVESDSEGGIKLTASNLETTIFSQVKSKLLAVSVPGAMCLPAKRLIDIVQLMEDGPVKITSDENGWLRIIAKGSSFKLPGTPVSSYPDFPGLETLSWIEVPAAHLKNILPATKYAITGDDARHSMRGAKLEVDSGEVRVITTDGHRISVASGKLEGLPPDDFETLIPIEAIDEITKLLGNKTEGSVGIAASENTLNFRVGNRILTTRLIAGQFPSYQKPFADIGYETFANFNADVLARSIRKAMLCAKEETDKDKKSHAGISLHFDKAEIKITTSSPELGEATEVLDSNYNGEPLTIVCSGQYLLDFLDPVGSGRIKFEVKDKLSQMYLIGEREGISYYYCCMPMRS